jgi:hypothetical protein
MEIKEFKISEKWENTHFWKARIYEEYIGSEGEGWGEERLCLLNPNINRALDIIPR